MADRRRNKPPNAPGPAAPRSEPERPAPKAVIFDVGRVIVRLDLQRALGALAAGMRGSGTEPGKRLSPEDTWKLIIADPRWPDWQEGRLSPADWHEHLMRRLKLSLNFREFRDAWNQVLDPELILGEDLFLALSGRCRLALLSNTDPIHVECLERQFTFGRHFAVRIYSCRVGASKPSAAIYQKALESLGLKARECLYVDDIQEFVDAAKRVGLDAIRFETPDSLAVQLRKRGLV